MNKEFDEISINTKAEEESEIGFERVRFEDQENRGRLKARGLFSISSNSTTGSGRIPTAYKTVSHSIDERLQEDKVGIDNESILELTWHTDTVEDVCRLLDTNLETGLTEQQVAEKVKSYGRNVQKKPSSNIIKRTFFYFFNGFGALLLTAGVLVLICYKPLGDPPAIANLILGIILLVVFIVQAALNFFQDYSSSQILNSINFLLPNDVKVLRSGEKTILNCEELVPGDVIFIEKNCKILADLRIVELSGLQFDRCILTGETKPVKGKVVSDNFNYLENESIAMQGTTCIDGFGRGVVVNTGSQTMFGRISQLSSKQREKLTTLQKELFRFIAFVAFVIVAINILLIILWAAWLRHSYPGWISVPTLIVDIASVTVSFIPEGLPIAMTVCLIVAATNMRNKGVLCKSLTSIETLGSINVLCSDKTGTLTTGKMVVSTSSGDQKRVKLVGRLCNECFNSGEGILGNQTDQVIMSFCDDLKVETSEFELARELSFNSKNKFMIKIYQTGDGYLFTVKGAPEILIEKAKYITKDGNISELDHSAKQELIKRQFEWCNEGERVVMLGSYNLTEEAFDKIMSNYSEDDELDIDDFEFSIDGLVGISDPLREGVLVSIEELKAAHIKIVMITGDFEVTAKAIATKCGIVRANATVDRIDTIGNSSECIIINGHELFRMSEIEWDRLMDYNQVVFSRTTPEHKLKIVKEFQQRKNIVGMIGDGVNDSPSIKQADIGVSMVDASEMAKDASDIILMDSFIDIIHGIKHGRLVFDNLKKTISYLLPAGCYSELWPVLLNVIFGFPQMLLSFLMIIICCVTDCIAAMIISYEKEESNILKKQPRQVSGEKLVNAKLFFHSYITLGTYYCFTSMLLAFLNFKREGFSFSELHKYNVTDEMNQVLSRSSSIYFVNLVILQFFNLVTIRTRYISCFRNINKKLLVILPIFASTFIWNYIPSLQKAIGSDSIPVEYYFISIGFGVVILAYDELRKLVVRRKPNSFLAKIAW